MIEVVQIPVLSDNYVYLLREPNSGLVAVVDPAVPEPVRRALESRGWKLDFIFNTHHHRDHVGANLALKSTYGCTIYGAEKDRARIPGLDRGLRAAEEFPFGAEIVKVLGADGHTIGHICYWFPNSKLLFCGDTIFSLGCGKLFEGSAEEMWETLSRLRSLPEDTLVYCAHEYTLENAAYALKVEPGNPALIARIAQAEAARRSGQATVPTTLGGEKETNPFLRPESLEIQERLGVRGEPLWRVFAEIRGRKDAFDSSGEF